MAANKKSFLMYSDFSYTFNELTDEEAGKLIKHIFGYVNDENPIVDDRIVKVAFEPIKQQLKRDLVSYEDKKIKNSVNGKIGGLKKAENAKIVAKASEAKKDVANLADTVNDTVNEIKKTFKTPVDTGSIDFEKFIRVFNSEANRNFTVTRKVKEALKARLKDYTKEQIISAIKKAHLDQWHIDTNFKYLTPELVLRSDKLERFINMPEVKKFTNYGGVTN